MKFKSKLSVFILSCCLFSLPAYAVESDIDDIPSVQAMNSHDPYESFNRSMFEFNMRFNDNIGRPVADVYAGVLPQTVRRGVENFFSNLTVPLSAINSFLQGNGEDGFSSIMRFTLNSTYGLFGLIDIATPAGLEDKKEDLGQTLFVWGLWEESNYVVLPFVGSYTMRELVGGNVDSIYNPIYPYVIDTDMKGRAVMYLSGKFIDYTKVVKFIDDLKNQPDPYIFTRESYLQYRTNLLYNGNPPNADLDDFNFDE